VEREKERDWRVGQQKGNRLRGEWKDVVKRC
jgi:hypothetical protein